MINSNLISQMKLYLDVQILASEASRLQIGAANCNQRGGGGGGGVALSDVSPLELAGHSYSRVQRCIDHPATIMLKSHRGLYFLTSYTCDSDVVSGHPS